jgi:hypothetical protein
VLDTRCHWIRNQIPKSYFLELAFPAQTHSFFPVPSSWHSLSIKNRCRYLNTKSYQLKTSKSKITKLSYICTVLRKRTIYNRCPYPVGDTNHVQRTTWLVLTNCQIFPLKSVLYVEINNVENLLVKFDSFVWSNALFTVHWVRSKCVRSLRPTQQPGFGCNNVSCQLIF